MKFLVKDLAIHNFHRFKKPITVSIAVIINSDTCFPFVNKFSINYDRIHYIKVK